MSKSNQVGVDLNLQHFEDALHSGDEKKVKHALYNLLNFVKIHNLNQHNSEVEYGLTTPTNPDIAVPTVMRMVDGLEGRPGVTVYERRVSPWVKRDSKPITQGGVFQ